MLGEVRLLDVRLHPPLAHTFSRLARFTSLHAQPPSGVVAHEEMSPLIIIGFEDLGSSRRESQESLLSLQTLPFTVFTLSCPLVIALSYAVHAIHLIRWYI